LYLSHHTIFELNADHLNITTRLRKKLFWTFFIIVYLYIYKEFILHFK
jgi:hypothetical protein